MSEKPAIITVEQAVQALPDKVKLLTFVLTPGGGRKFLERKKEEIINRMTELGGADVSGENCLRWGFGLAMPYAIDKDQQPIWLFVETIPNLCPFCLGKGVIKADQYDIVGETCWVCEGQPVETEPLPQRPTLQ